MSVSSSTDQSSSLGGRRMVLLSSLRLPAHGRYFHGHYSVTLWFLSGSEAPLCAKRCPASTFELSHPVPLFQLYGSRRVVKNIFSTIELVSEARDLSGIMWQILLFDLIKSAAPDRSVPR